MDELVFWMMFYGDVVHGIPALSPFQKALSQLRSGVPVAVNAFLSLQADAIDVSESVRAEPVSEVE